MQLTAVKNLSSGGGLKVEYGTATATIDQSFSFQPIFTIPNAPILLILCSAYINGGNLCYRFVPNVSSTTEVDQYWNNISVDIGFYVNASSTYQGRFARVGNTVYCSQNSFSNKEIEIHYALIG